MNDKQILITGATNGIGLAAAEALAALGANLAIVGRSKTRTGIASARIKAAAGRRATVATFIADLSSQAAVRRFAADNVIPLVHFEKNDRKIDVMRPNLAVQAATGRSGVAAIGVAQEFARVFLATKHTGQTTGVWFSFAKGETIIQVHGMGPFEINYINAADDPRRQKE